MSIFAYQLLYLFVKSINLGQFERNNCNFVTHFCEYVRNWMMTLLRIGINAKKIKQRYI